MGIFNSIKKSRRESSDIDEKIEYLNKELEKTGLREAMTTSNMYVSGGRVPNEDYVNFNGLSHGGYGLGLSGADGNSLGGASVGDHPSIAGLTGVALSPPHPVTGVRRVASHVTDGIGSNTPLRPGVTIARGFGDNPNYITMGSAVWFWDSNYNSGEGRWVNFEWFDGGLGFWDTNFLGFFFHNKNLDEYQLSGVNIGTQIKNKIAGIKFGSNGGLGEPQTIVLTKNDLDDPSFIPIDTMSSEAYQYLLNKTGTKVASGDVDFDLYNWYLKTYPNSGAAQWYLNNPNSNPRSNPFLKPTDYIPFTDRASNPNQPVSDIDINPGLGAKPGDQLAFFGGNKNNNKTPEKPTKKTRKGTLDATKASTGMYTNMTPEIFQQKYGMSFNEYLNLP